MTKDHPLLPAAQWTRLAPLLSEPAPSLGVMVADTHLFIGAVLWHLRRGVSWRDLPECFGAWSTVFARFSRWEINGLFNSLLSILQDEGGLPALLATQPPGGHTSTRRAR